MRWRGPIIGVLILCCLGAVRAGVRPAHTEAWLEDYAQLRDHMASAYANLDWMIATHAVDVRALDSTTEARIRSARTDREAKQAITAFLAAFHDGHVREVTEPPRLVQVATGWWASRRIRGNGQPVRGWTGAQACAALGYSEGSASWSVPFDRQPGYRDLGEMGPLRAGVIARGADTVGLVRIRRFSPQHALAACERAWNTVIRESLYKGPCDDDCAYHLRQEVGEAMLASIRSWLEQMRSVGARTVLVDLGGNGGGTEWADDAARMFAQGPLESPFTTGVRHPHTAKQLEQRVAEMDSAIAWPGLNESLRQSLMDARDRVESLAELARDECDRQGIWHDPAIARDCPGTLPLQMHTTGPLAWLPDGAFDGAAEASLLYAPAGRRTRSAAWTGKLVILMDRRTASASEQFVATLRDNGRAVTLGERTLGAGCGYTDGGIPLTLRNSGMQILVPDCARVRKDGTNEVFGIAPDVPVKLDASAVIAAAVRSGR